MTPGSSERVRVLGTLWAAESIFAISFMHCVIYNRDKLRHIRGVVFSPRSKVYPCRCAQVPCGGFYRREPRITTPANPPKHFLYINDEGLPEAADVYTGEVIPLQLTARQLADYRRVRVDGKTRWVPLVELAVPIKYSPLLAEEICALLLEGQGIMKTLQAVGMQYREYCSMRRVYPEFADMVDQARRDRSEVFFDKMEEVAETTPAFEEDIALGRLKVDVYKHMSEVGDPSRFGKKTTIQGKIGVGIIKVDTGIDRERVVDEVSLQEIANKQAEIAASEIVSVAVHMPTNLPKKSEEL